MKAKVNLLELFSTSRAQDDYCRALEEAEISGGDGEDRAQPTRTKKEKITLNVRHLGCFDITSSAATTGADVRVVAFRPMEGPVTPEKCAAECEMIENTLGSPRFAAIRNGKYCSCLEHFQGFHPAVEGGGKNPGFHHAVEGKCEMECSGDRGRRDELAGDGGTTAVSHHWRDLVYGPDPRRCGSLHTSEVESVYFWFVCPAGADYWGGQSPEGPCMQDAPVCVTAMWLPPTGAGGVRVTPGATGSITYPNRCLANRAGFHDKTHILAEGECDFAGSDNNAGDSTSSCGILNPVCASHEGPSEDTARELLRRTRKDVVPGFEDMVNSFLELKSNKPNHLTIPNACIAKRHGFRDFAPGACTDAQQQAENAVGPCVEDAPVCVESAKITYPNACNALRDGFTWEKISNGRCADIMPDVEECEVLVDENHNVVKVDEADEKAGAKKKKPSLLPTVDPSDAHICVDGVTYSDFCSAKRAGHKEGVMQKGQCFAIGSPCTTTTDLNPAVCVNGNVTYVNRCMAVKDGVFPTDIHEGACTGAGGSGGIAATPSVADSSTDQPSTSINICRGVSQPVCVDGITYGSECSARNAGKGVFRAGPCEQITNPCENYIPTCAIARNITYPNSCLAYRDGVPEFPSGLLMEGFCAQHADLVVAERTKREKELRRKLAGRDHEDDAIGDGIGDASGDTSASGDHAHDPTTNNNPITHHPIGSCPSLFRPVCIKATRKQFANACYARKAGYELEEWVEKKCEEMHDKDDQCSIFDPICTVSEGITLPNSCMLERDPSLGADYEEGYCVDGIAFGKEDPVVVTTAVVHDVVHDPHRRPHEAHKNTIETLHLDLQSLMNLGTKGGAEAGHQQQSATAISTTSMVLFEDACFNFEPVCLRLAVASESSPYRPSVPTEYGITFLNACQLKNFISSYPMVKSALSEPPVLGECRKVDRSGVCHRLQPQCMAQKDETTGEMYGGVTFINPCMGRRANEILTAISARAGAKQPEVAVAEKQSEPEKVEKVEEQKWSKGNPFAKHLRRRRRRGLIQEVERSSTTSSSGITGSSTGGRQASFVFLAGVYNDR